MQFLHLTGLNEVDKVRAGYDAVQAKAVVRPFLSEMELALGAADVAISRAGASSMAELAAMRLPAVLIPYPAATDNHQLHNARTYVEAGAAVLFDQKHSDAEALSGALVKLFSDAAVRERMRRALDSFHHAGAAQLIAERMLALLSARSGREPLRPAPRDATGTPLHQCRQIQPSR